VLPTHGVLVEIDSREFHERQFEKDHERGSLFDRLGYHWISLTPNQIEFRPNEALQAIEGALRRCHQVQGSNPNRVRPRPSQPRVG
jgi:very-short-patch-repair endonuclease